jgi:hypothetical protein
MFRFTVKAPKAVPVNLTGVPEEDPRTISFTAPANAGTAHMNSSAVATKVSEAFFIVVIEALPPWRISSTRGGNYSSEVLTPSDTIIKVRLPTAPVSNRITTGRTLVPNDDWVKAFLPHY